MSVAPGSDLCGGAENFPVVIESGAGESPVADFEYTPENLPGPGCDCHPSQVTFAGCECHSTSCQRESCSCLQTHGQVYDGEGRLRQHSHEQGDYSRPVFECNALCRCGESCINRVVQRGLSFRLSVFPTRSKGWGVRALEFIPRGSFVCEYAGEVLGYEEACRRQRAQGPGDMNYILALREHAGLGRICETFVDPAVVGNVGRFLNHSCQPNLMMVPVRVDSPVPRLALFTLCDVSAGEELTFDYAGTHSSSEPSLNAIQGESSSSPDTRGTDVLKRKPCHCGAPNCRVFLPLDVSVIGTN